VAAGIVKHLVRTFDGGGAPLLAWPTTTSLRLAALPAKSVLSKPGSLRERKDAFCRLLDTEPGELSARLPNLTRKPLPHFPALPLRTGRQNPGANMEQDNFRDFGELYRAAFAERDPTRKLVLLHEVQKRIDQWEERSSREAQAEAAPSNRIDPQLSSGSRQSPKAA